MRHRILLVFVTLAIITVMIAASIAPSATVQADNVLQDMPSLQGYQIYFSEMFSEASRFDRTDSGLSRLAGLLELLGADQYTLEWRTGVPEDADLVVIAGPTKSMGTDQVAWLWAYLQGGGRLLLLAEPPAYGGTLTSTRDLLQLMWDDMGLRGRDDVVVLQGESIIASPPGDTVRANTPTPTPLPAVEVQSLSDLITADTINTFHPIATGIDGSLTFFGARSLEIDSAPRESQVTPLVYAPAAAYGESNFKAYLTNQFAEYNIGDDTAPGNLVLAAAMDDIATGARVVLIGDRDFSTNGSGFQTAPPYSGSFLYPDNVRFMLNSVAWLLGAETTAGDMTFPTPGSTPTPTITPSPTPLPEAQGEGS